MEVYEIYLVKGEGLAMTKNKNECHWKVHSQTENFEVKILQECGSEDRGSACQVLILKIDLYNKWQEDLIIS
jgi:hypothetical protein